MSLINDALKRASQSIKQRGPIARDEHQMQPVESTVHRNLLPLIGVPVALAILFGLAGWFFWKGMRAGQPAVAASAPTNATAQVAAAKTNVAAGEKHLLPKLVEQAKTTIQRAAAVQDQTVEGAPTTTVSALPQESTPTSVPPVQALPPAAPPAFPQLKLQGIYYSLTKPSAIINGQHLYVGETVAGVKVVQIDRQSVTVELAGYKKVIPLH